MLWSHMERMSLGMGNGLVSICYIYIYGKCLGFALNRNDDGQRIIIIIIISTTIIIINNFVDFPNWM